MSFSKTALAGLVTLSAMAQATPTFERMSDADIEFVQQAGGLERDLSNSALTGKVSENIKDKLKTQDLHAIQALKAAGDTPQQFVSDADRNVMAELQEAADKPVNAWLDALEGSPFVSPGMRATAMNEGGQPDNQLSEDVRLLVFISLGMPEGTLKSLFKQADGRADIVFVIRGWKPPHFQQVIQRVRQLQPENAEAASVIVDPNLYRQYKVSQVPMFLSMDKKGAWRRLYGEISLEGARQEIEGGRFNQQVGPTYAVAEPDILSEIEARAASYDWQGELEGAQERARSFRPGVDLPTSDKDEVYFVDPTITVNQDVINPQTGEVIAAAGTEINPLESIVMDRPYVVFDPDAHGQVALVKEWLKEHPFSLLIATRLPEYQEGTPGLAEELKAEVFTLNPQIVERLAIKATPSFIQQENNLLKITVRRRSL